mgnify:CR=1 FL=1
MPPAPASAVRSSARRLAAIARLACAGACCLLAGCATQLSLHRAPKADFTRLRHVFVEHRLNDNHHLDDAIVAALQKLGYHAASGALTMMPDDTDALVTYEDVWTFDFTDHMIGLTLTVTDEHKQEPMGDARFYRPSVTHLAPDRIVQLTVADIFPPAAAGPAAPAAKG